MAVARCDAFRVEVRNLPVSTHWTCPYCNRIATLIDTNVSSSNHNFDCGNKDGYSLLRTTVIVCPNHECRNYTIAAGLYRYNHDSRGNRTQLRKPESSWSLKPQSSAKPFPDYIPAALRSDYEEACLIASLSPKASATLSRRCLQGMIRNFWNITKPRLIEEILALEDKVDPQTWEAIDAVRSIGNIGAHMEKDISLIVDVDPDEAQLLIELIETLMTEWYVHKHDRDEKMNAIAAVAAAKKAQQIQPAAAAPKP